MPQNLHVPSPSQEIQKRLQMIGQDMSRFEFIEFMKFTHKSVSYKTHSSRSLNVHADLEKYLLSKLLTTE
jgi:hypothetical protein